MNRLRLWLVFSAGNAALLGLVWIWLGLPDATPWHLAASAALGVGVVLGLLALHGAAMGAWRGIAPGTVVRRLPALVVWLLAAAAVVAGVYRAVPDNVARRQWLEPGLALVAVLLLLPLASRMTVDGVAAAGLGAAWRPLLGWRFYAAVAVFATLGLYVPWRLILWVPELRGLLWESASAAARFGLAYGLTMASWLLLYAAASDGSQGGEAVLHPTEDNGQPVAND